MNQRYTNGIGIVLADSPEELEDILKTIGVIDVFPLGEITEKYQQYPDAIYTAVLPNKESMDTLLEYFQVRRGVLSYGGRRVCIGYSLSWIKRCMLKVQPYTAKQVKT